MLRKKLYFIGALAIAWALVFARPSYAINLDSSYDMNLLVINYYPKDASGRVVDPQADVTNGNYKLADWTLDEMRDATEPLANYVVDGLTRATRYHLKSNKNAQPAIRFKILDTVEKIAPVPVSSKSDGNPGHFRINYYKLLDDLPKDICDYVENYNVGGVWVFRWPTSDVTYEESKMNGPYGDISNSYYKKDMPRCRRTYRLYMNVITASQNLLHGFSHQMEVELISVDKDNAFRFLRACKDTKFEDGCIPMADSARPKVGGCGWTHVAPNSSREYDLTNAAPNDSDCYDWKPDGTGQLSSISCNDWSCGVYGGLSLTESVSAVREGPDYKHVIWLWQNMPGRNNNVYVSGKKYRSWWDVHGDWDGMHARGERLTYSDSGPPQVSILAPTSEPTYTTSASTLIVLGAAITDDNHVFSASWRNDATGASGALELTAYGWIGREIQLNIGENKIIVSATDDLGNVGTDELTITRADTTPPVVSFIEPTKGGPFSTTESTVKIIATATDNLGYDNIAYPFAWFVWLNQQLRSGGTMSCLFAACATVIDLGSGVNDIVVYAKDKSNNLAYSSIKVTKLDTAPTPVLVASPSTVKLGGRITFQVSGGAANALFDVRLSSRDGLKWYDWTSFGLTDSSGKGAAGPITVPSSTPLGKYFVQARVAGVKSTAVKYLVTGY